ncbi:ZYBA0S06-04214g1_1 [Zygosaccharomyces bailii CLIB 213]|uniref:V-type proton ATPase subunit H n=1 Tax=Zygosaccharomyces bailii (strain CLIB 213 / ATCC 58445 / CBS 680 / BCRC 21525 / NBRC 1098 / NCYC 1416 / NRRL Y-2227) TaxID=1333698 RepID=A0A8J2TA26_ZYGB2|nr:ZYBA0S06-04214g1_1 [Zygosaccharomyces bailii CLIB 213]
MILLNSTHFNDIRHAMRSRSVAWDALARSAEISEPDASNAKAIESILVKHANEPGFAADPSFKINESTIAPLIHLLATSTNADSKKAVQNLLAEMLSSAEYSGQTINFFVEHKAALEELFQVSLVGDAQTVLISSFNLVSLLIQPGLLNKDLMSQLINNDNFLNILNNLELKETCYICVRLLQELVALEPYRLIAWKAQSKFVPTLFLVVKQALASNSATKVVATNSNNLGIQLQYYSLLVIWLLTFDRKVAHELTSLYLPDFLNLLKLVKVTIKEKISRLCISIILQCVSKNVKGHKQVIRSLLLLGNALPVLQSLSERKYSDEELRTNMDELKGILEAEYQELSSFDEYVAELDSKLLCWSPSHVDNGFWSDNVDKFKQNHWKLFKQLVSLLLETKQSGLNDKQHKVVLEVALSDITHVVDLLPESVNVLGEMKGKVVIMELLNYPDSRVKYEALKATQAVIGYTFK